MIDQYIQQYGRRLYGLCRHLCANPQDADDLYQDTWLKAIKNISRYDRSRDFEPWLTQICVNTYRNTLRRLARSPFFDAFADNREKDRVFENARAPGKPEYGALYEAVDGLPEKYRVAVVLFYFQDMNLERTAGVLGIPVGTVKSRLNKARKLLRKCLDTEQADAELETASARTKPRKDF